MNVLNKYYEIVTPQEKTKCVFWFIETKSDIQIQQRCRMDFNFVSIQS